MPVPTTVQDIPLDLAGQVGGTTPPAGPPLSFFDKVKLGWKSAGAGPDWGFNQVNWRNSAIGDINEALRKKGVAPVVDLMDPSGWGRTRPIKPGESADDYRNRLYGEVFGQVDRVRAQDPKFLPEYAQVHDESALTELVHNRRNQSLAEVGQAAPDGLGLGGFVGAAGHGFVDPTSYIPIGGPAVKAVGIGRAILGTALREGAANMALTTVEEPFVRQDAKALGIDRTMSDTVFDIGAAGVTGAGIGSTFKALGIAFEHLRGKQAIGPVSDVDVANAFTEAVPPEHRTPDEQAAVHAIHREADVKSTSPFVESPAGDDAHATWLDRALSAVTGGPDAPHTVKPLAREAIAAGEDVSGTRQPGRETLKAKIHRVEAPGANDYNEASGAMGPYQFTARTWVSLFKRRYPGDGRSFDQIASLRRDPHLNDVLINDLIGENSAALRHAGFDDGAGNLYLAHVLGHDRAVTVLRADPHARLGDLLPEGYFKGNPFKPTDSAASLVRWAYGKMGDASGVPEHIAAAAPNEESAAAATEQTGPEIEIPTGDQVVEAMLADVAGTDRPILKPELFNSPEEHAAAQVRFERETDMADGFAPVMSRAEAFSPHEHFDALRTYQGKVTPDAIGEALGLTPDEVKRAVGAMQSVDANSPFVLTRGRPPKLDKMGNITREGTEPGRLIRRPPKVIKPNETLLEYVSRHGGLQDQGGDLAAMGAGDWHKGGKFRRKLINENGQSLDDAFQAAIDAGYFPEHMAEATSYGDLPDVATFLEAIDEEIRGRPRHSVVEAVDAAEVAKRAQYQEEAPPETLDQIQARIHERVGHNMDALIEAADRRGLDLSDDELLVDASDLIDLGLDPDQALGDAMLESAYRNLDRAAAETGNGQYAIGPDERFSNDGFPEERGGDGGDLAAVAGGGGSEGFASVAEEARAGLAQSAHDPARGTFSDPVGPPAEAQADSAIHDAEMTSPEGATYRLDEEGGDSDLASILDEINEEQKAATEMRNCLKPKGTGE